MEEALRDKRRRAGRLGGLQTYLRHGRRHFVDAGRKGGLNHPRALTYERDILPLELQYSKKQKRGKEKLIKLVAGNNVPLSVLNKLWRQKMRERQVIAEREENNRIDKASTRETGIVGAAT